MPKEKKAPVSAVNPADAIAQIERPRFKWKAVLQIVAALAIVWVTSLILVPFAGYWAVGLAGLVTVVLMGFGIYVWRLTRRSQAVVDIMKGATDEAGRQRAIDKLAKDGSKDAMKALARAQLVAQSRPSEALEILEGIDLAKTQAVLQDDIRSQIALLYLRGNRVRDARAVADEIRLDRQPNAKAKAMYAAVIAETFARTGKVDEAKTLIETYSPDDPEYGEARALLLRAQIFTYHALKKRGLVKQSMAALARIEPGLLGGFIQKGNQPELMKAAKQVLASSGMAPKPKMKRVR
jgi:hypothetical protein